MGQQRPGARHPKSQRSSWARINRLSDSDPPGQGTHNKTGNSQYRSIVYYGNTNKRTVTNGTTQTAGDKRLAAAPGPLESVIAKKFIKTLSVAEAPSRGSVPARSQVTTSGAPPNGIFKMGTELMYGGQGKITSMTNLTTVTDTQNDMVDVMDTSTRVTEPGGGLAPPRLIDTKEEATGNDRRKLRLQNKRRRQR